MLNTSQKAAGIRMRDAYLSIDSIYYINLNNAKNDQINSINNRVFSSMN